METQAGSRSRASVIPTAQRSPTVDQTQPAPHPRRYVSAGRLSSAKRHIRKREMQLSKSQRIGVEDEFRLPKKKAADNYFRSTLSCREDGGRTTSLWTTQGKKEALQ